jgi:hypothetical protein
MTITPDTKNWTWVLERPCPECGFAAGDIARDEVPALLRANAEGWRRYFAEAGTETVRTRTEPTKWSPLEYACHVRDCNKLYTYRIELMLEQDDPQYPDWDQDATAVEAEYGKQDPDTVVAEVADTTEIIAALLASITDEQGRRTGHRGDGSDFTIDTLARYFVHDPIHHLWDVTGQRYESA